MWQKCANVVWVFFEMVVEGFAVILAYTLTICNSSV